MKYLAPREWHAHAKLVPTTAKHPRFNCLGNVKISALAELALKLSKFALYHTCEICERIPKEA